MSNLYVIHDGESMISIVKGNSKEEAFDIFVSKHIEGRTPMENEILNEYISEFIVNDSLLGDFYRDDEGHFFDDLTGELPERIKQLSKDQQIKYIDSWIEKNARHFWSDKPQFADEYLRELNKSRNSKGDYKAEFSHEFWVDTVKKVVRSWNENINIVKVELEDDNYQLIYDEFLNY